MISKPFVDLEPEGFEYPLVTACERGHLGVVRELVASGKVNVNAKSRSEGKTALLTACDCGHYDIVLELVQQCDDLDTDGLLLYIAMTILVFFGLAFQTGISQAHVDIAELLLHWEGLDVNAIARDGRTMFEIVCENLYHDVSGLDLLMRCPRIEVNGCTSAAGMTGLHLAASGNDHTLGLLLECDRVDVNAVDKVGWTPLHAACGMLHSVGTTVGALAACERVDVTVEDEMGVLPVHLAKLGGQEDVVRAIKSSGGARRAWKGRAGWKTKVNRPRPLSPFPSRPTSPTPMPTPERRVLSCVLPAQTSPNDHMSPGGGASPLGISYQYVSPRSPSSPSGYATPERPTSPGLQRLFAAFRIPGSS